MSILPSDTPRLPKWPFLLGDAVLLTIAALLAAYGQTPYSNSVIIAIAVCVALASILGAIPFLTDYANKQDEALDERQRGLEALTRTISDSAEQISVAASSLHEINELARQQLAQAVAIPEQLQDSLESFKLELNETVTAASESLKHDIKSIRTSETRKIDATAESIQLALTELKQLETAVVKLIEETKSRPGPKTEKPEKKLPEPEAPKVASNATTEELPEVPIPVVEANPAIVKPEPDAIPTVTESKKEEVIEDEAPKPVKKPATPRKPKLSEPKEPVTAPNDEDLTLTGEDPSSDTQKTVASDGATRLFVTAYIGIGNRLFIRGDGAGLNPDKGVPLQFVSIGKWQWESKDATEPLRVRLYKNDEIECLSPGELSLEPGHQIEVSASF